MKRGKSERHVKKHVEEFQHVEEKHEREMVEHVDEKHKRGVSDEKRGENKGGEKVGMILYFVPGNRTWTITSRGQTMSRRTTSMRR